MRSFIAFDLPERVKGEIEKVQNLLKNHGLNCRFKRRDNFHLTLKFLGEIDELQREAVIQSLSGLAKNFSPFNLTVGGFGAFPNTANVRVLWLGVGGELEVLTSLQSELEKEMVSIGFPREKKKGFTPHITIAQDFKTPLFWERTGFHQYNFNFIVPIKEIILMKSEHLGGKRVYSPEAVFPLSHCSI